MKWNFPKTSDLWTQILVIETLDPHSLLELLIFQQSCLKKHERKVRVQPTTTRRNFLKKLEKKKKGLLSGSFNGTHIQLQNVLCLVIKFNLTKKKFIEFN